MQLSRLAILNYFRRVYRIRRVLNSPIINRCFLWLYPASVEYVRLFCMLRARLLLFSTFTRTRPDWKWSAAVIYGLELSNFYILIFIESENIYVLVDDDLFPILWPLSPQTKSRCSITTSMESFQTNYIP